MKTTILRKRMYGTVREAERAAALGRLICLLEGGEPTGGDGNERHIARLDGARAGHALAATREMVRVSEGAWLRSRYN